MGRMLIWILVSNLSYVFLKTYVQATASLDHIRQITCIACQLVDSPFVVGRGAVVSGWFNQVGYGAAAFKCYPDVCVTEYVCDLAYLCIRIPHHPSRTTP